MSQTSATETSDPLIGQRIKGRYRILRVHARGGMSLLYAASDEQGADEVAIKVLDRARIDDLDAVARFLDEARVQSAVEHERVVAVLDFGRLPDGRPFLVMPLVAGEDVATLLSREGPQHPSRVAQLLADVAAALDTMHARGIVHRDIKSENLMCAKGRDGSEAVLVLDFGVAAAALRNARAPAADPRNGTPEFMPPEALAGDVYDRRGDIYALATVAFELITGRLPFVGSDPKALAEAKAQAAPKLSEVFTGEIPPALDAIVARGLAKDPSRRPRSAAQFVRDLAAAARLLPRDDTPPPTRASASSGPSAESSVVVGPRRSTRPGYARVLSDPPPAPPPSARPSAPEAPTAKAPSKTNGTAKRASIEPARTSSASKRASVSVSVVRAEESVVKTTDAPAVGPAPEAVNHESCIPVPVSASLDRAVEDDLATLRPPRPSVGRWLAYAAVLAVAVVLACILFGRSSFAPEAAAPPEPEPATLAPTAAAEPEPQPSPTEVAQSTVVQEEPAAAAAAEPEPATAIEPAAAVVDEATASSDAVAAPALRSKPSRAARTKRRNAVEGTAVESPIRVRDEAPSEEPAQANARERAKGLTDEGVEAMLAGRFDEAAKLFAKAVAIDGGYAPAWRSRGLVLERLGRDAQAANAFRRYLDLAPSGPAADAVRARLDALQ